MYGARILIADDHPLVLESVKQLLEPTFPVIGTVKTGQELLEAAQELRPNIVLLDCSMPGMDGFEAARRLKALLPTVKIIFVTMLTEAIAVNDAFRLGAMGYVLKQAAADELHAAVKSVMMNRRFVSPLLNAEVREAMECEWSKPEGYTADLTERQRQVLVMLANGSTTKNIAEDLNISMKTVEFHKFNITRKLGVRTTSDLIRFALDKGMTAL